MSDMSSDIAKDNSPEEQICLLYDLGAVPGSGKSGYVTTQALSCIATLMTQIVQAPGISTPLWFLLDIAIAYGYNLHVYTISIICLIP
jgi:hypothetical protein